MPIEPKIKDWLRYIRPHMATYEALRRGGRGEYIAKLSKETELSDNSLRRMVFAAQFLEGEGVTELPPGVNLAVGAVERIARIAAREPEKRRELLADTIAGKLTIRQLRNMLKTSEKAAKRTRTQAPDVSVLELAEAELKSRGIAVTESVDILSMPDAWCFLAQTRPARAYIDPKAGRIVVFDETIVGGTAATFVRLRKEFLQNILIAPALYDLVLVWAPSLHADARQLIDTTMRPDAGAKVKLLSAKAEIAPASERKKRRRSGS